MDLVHVWFACPRLSFAFSTASFFFFFFSACMNSNRTIHAHEFTIQETKCTVHALFTHCLRDPQPFYSEKIYIKNEPHGTIHTFKNYFVIVFSVFSFQFLAK